MGATNKKKQKTKQSKKDVKIDESAEENDSISKPMTQSPPIFTRMQLASLILLSLGISRLIKVGSAISMDENPRPVCKEYLGEEACADAGVNALLRLKYYTGIQCVLLVIAAFLQCWNREDYLGKINNLLMFSPVGTAVLALGMSIEVIPSETVFQHLVMCLVLTIIASPSSLGDLPFVSGRRAQSYKTLQSLVLMTLAIMSLWEAVQLVLPAVLGETIVDTFLVQPSSSHAAATFIVIFLAIDKLTQTLIYAFSWFYMKENGQRSMLLLIGGIKMMVYYHQLPFLKDDLSDIDMLQMAELTAGIFCFIAWIAPTITWKKKL